MSSSSESDEEDWVLYKDRDEWKDVTPVEQDDGPHPVVAIAYTEKFKDVYNYFRAVLKSNEHSKRAFDLVNDAITMNAANYTVWAYRRVLLQTLNIDLKEELNYVTATIRKQPKNYQVWYHRGKIIQWMDDPSRELTFTTEMLQRDAKNYHCWQHRQLVLNTFNLWEGEVAFTTTVIQNDCRNNSAWNQRYYAIKNTTGFTRDVVEEEVRYTVDWIKTVLHNESSWNYLTGILQAFGGLLKFPHISESFESMLKEGCDSAYLLSFLVDYYEEALVEDSTCTKHAARAVELCSLLANEIDLIRVEYWNHVKRTIQTRYLPHGDV